MKNSLRNLLAFVFLFAMGYFFLMGSQTQTPEEFDQEFIAKYDACILRAKIDVVKVCPKWLVMISQPIDVKHSLVPRQIQSLNSIFHLFLSLLEMIQSTIPETTVKTLNAAKILINQWEKSSRSL